MENYTQVKVELDIMAQKLINQYLINNEKIEKEIEAGIKKAFDNIDIEKEVEQSVKHAIEQAIRDSSDWGKIRAAVRKKTDEIVDAYIERAISKFKQEFQNE